MSMSMFNEMDVTSVLGEIALLRGYADNAVLLVEGPSDSRFFSAFVSSPVCDIVIAYGRGNSLETLRRLRTRRVRGVVCVIDRDLDDHFGGPLDDPDVVVTDCPDIEVMMIRSSSFDKLVAELGALAKIKALRTDADGIRAVILERAGPVLFLKYLSRALNLGLKFQDLKYRFVNTMLEFDETEMIISVLNHSQKTTDSVDELSRGIVEARNSGIQLWDVGCGHVLTEFIGRAFRSLFGTHNSGDVSADKIESRLRLGFSEFNFKLCDLFTKLTAWENRNAPYRVLKP